jgi:hypothetical protein
MLAQPRISNVRFELDNKAKLIEISYDASGLAPTDSIYITVTGRKTGAIVPGQLTGAIGTGVKSGKNRKILWDVVADNLKINDILSVLVHVRTDGSPVMARTDSSIKKEPIVKTTKKTGRKLNGPALLMLGGGLVVGGGMYYMSTVLKAKSADSYELYKQQNWIHKDDLTFTGSDPELQKMYSVYLDNAKKDYNRAKRQKMMSGVVLVAGIGIVLADAIFTIPIMVQPKNKKVGLFLEMDSGGFASAGLQIKF